MDGGRDLFILHGIWQKYVKENIKKSFENEQTYDCSPLGSKYASEVIAWVTSYEIFLLHELRVTFWVVSYCLLHELRVNF